jgi:hypothetical protein
MKAYEIIEQYQSLEYKRLETLRAMKAVENEFSKDFPPYTSVNWSERNEVWKVLRTIFVFSN